MFTSFYPAMKRSRSVAILTQTARSKTSLTMLKLRKRKDKPLVTFNPGLGTGIGGVSLRYSPGADPEATPYNFVGPSGHRPDR